ncbi:MAG: TIM barrel protein [Verrucomicrobia bacterium]|nr:TIM barrel protein [Verrucomicrobiota bacterium]
MNLPNYPKLHNATWPGIVGKGPDSPEPFIELDAMLDLTAAAEVDGQKFDGVDLFLCSPHVSIDSTDADLEDLAGRLQQRNLVAGSLVAPVWAPTGGGSAMGSPEEREQFVHQVGKACVIGRKLRELGVRPNGVVRIDSAVDPRAWAANPQANTALIADTFRRACDAAEAQGERLAAEGEICWGGMHSWKEMLKLLEKVDRPQALGFQADLAHTLLYLLGYNAPGDAVLPPDFDWNDSQAFHAAYRCLTDALRPWTVDFHVAQNDATVKGQGTHDKTGKHCLPDDPNGKLDIVKAAAFWLRDGQGNLTQKIRHICWDGCMFTNQTMLQPGTWNSILATMLEVRRVHGWHE